MPIHDWTRAPAGIFHHFHQSWTVEIARLLNGKYSAKDECALLEQSEITLPANASEASHYAHKANRISIQRPIGNVVAIIEIVSPGNKDSRHALRSFVDKAVELLRKGVHLLIVDLLPPSNRDPQGIHKAIWEQFTDDSFTLPPDNPLTLVAYQAGTEMTAYVEPVGVGDPLPDMPLFLDIDFHVLVPLEAAYQTTWDLCPEPLRALVQPAASV